MHQAELFMSVSLKITFAKTNKPILQTKANSPLQISTIGSYM